MVAISAGSSQDSLRAHLVWPALCSGEQPQAGPVGASFCDGGALGDLPSSTPSFCEPLEGGASDLERS